MAIHVSFVLITRIIIEKKKILNHYLTSYIFQKVIVVYITREGLLTVRKIEGTLRIFRLLLAVLHNNYGNIEEGHYNNMM